MSKPSAFGLSRRGVAGLGAGVLSLGALSVLAASPALARTSRGKAVKADIDILNVALGLEHEAIEAYQIGAESGLLQKPVLDVAVAFQAHHKGHRDALISTIQQLGGAPVMPKSRADYVSALNVSTLKTQTDVLVLAAKLEKGAANAYLGVIPSFNDRALAQVSARLAADETMHWTALTQALGGMLPKEALSFGA